MRYSIKKIEGHTKTSDLRNLDIYLQGRVAAQQFSCSCVGHSQVVQLQFYRTQASSLCVVVQDKTKQSSCSFAGHIHVVQLQLYTTQIKQSSCSFAGHRQVVQVQLYRTNPNRAAVVLQDTYKQFSCSYTGHKNVVQLQLCRTQPSSLAVVHLSSRHRKSECT